MAPKAQFGSYTRAFVAFAMAIGGGVAIYLSLPLKWMLIALPFALWETWTLVNDKPHDTISEIIWGFNKTTPLVPHAFGVFIGWLIGSGQLSFVDYGLGMLFGHFFFSRACVLTPEDQTRKELYGPDAV